LYEKKDIGSRGAFVDYLCDNKIIIIKPYHKQEKGRKFYYPQKISDLTSSYLFVVGFPIILVLGFD
jgi:hypothetical protein